MISSELSFFKVRIKELYNDIYNVLELLFKFLCIVIEVIFICFVKLLNLFFLANPFYHRNKQIRSHLYVIHT